MVDKPYTLNEAAEMLNISPQTLRREIDRGKIAAYRFGGRRSACRLSLYHGTAVQCVEGRACP